MSTAKTQRLETYADWSRGGAITTLLLILAGVVGVSAWLHCGVLHDVIMWDEADYVFAARHGIVANALDRWDLNPDLRHYHAPLSFYAIWLSTTLLGISEWTIRLPAVVISVLTSGLAVLAGYDLAHGRRKAKLIVGAVVGLLYATAPAAVLMTAVARPHPFVAFFLFLNIWTLCRYLLRPTRGRAVAFGLTLAGQFLSMEYGPVVVGLSFAAVALVRPHRVGVRWRWPYLVRSRLFPFIAVHRHLWVATGTCLAGIAVLWPAGLYKLHVLMNFAYYVRYAKLGHRTLFRGEIYEHVPKYAYVWWYATGYPLLLTGMGVAIGLILMRAWKQRGAVPRTLAVFTLGIGLSIHSSHIMDLVYSLYLIPPVILGGPLAGLWLARMAQAARLRGTRRMDVGQPAWWRLPGPIGAALAVLALGAILGGQTTQTPPSDRANTKLVRVVQELARLAKPGDEVLAQAWPVVRYVLLREGRDDLIVHQYDPRNYESAQLQQRFDTGEFDWVVTAGSTSRAYPACPLLIQLHNEWIVVAQGDAPPAESRVYAPPAVAHAMSLIGGSAVDSGRQ